MVRIRKDYLLVIVIAAIVIFTHLRPSSNMLSIDLQTDNALPRKLGDFLRLFRTVAVEKPTVFLIMPTHKGTVQDANLIRHCQTFRQVDHVNWIVIEDAVNKTELVTRILSECNIWNYTHLNAVKPKSDHSVHRGVHQRNAGLRWIRQNINPNQTKGVVYFSDDDNHYDTRLIDEMRYVKKFGVWPVALAAGQSFEGPVVVDGKVMENHDDSCEDDENEMTHITLLTYDFQTSRPSIAVLKDRMQRTGTARVQFIQTHSTDEFLKIFVQYKYLEQFKYPTFSPFPLHCVDLIGR